MNNESITPLVEEVDQVVRLGNGQRVAVTRSGHVAPASSTTRKGDRVRVAMSDQQGSRSYGDQVGAWSYDPSSGQDLYMPLGVVAPAAAAFLFQQAPRTQKLLRRLVIEADADTSGFVSDVNVAGQSLFGSSRPAGGRQFPLAAFRANLPALQKPNDANVIAPAAVPIVVQGGYNNALTDVTSGSWATDLVPPERGAVYARSSAAGKSTAGIGRVNWLFDLVPQFGVANGAQVVLQNTAARPCRVGWLVLQVNGPAAGFAIIARALGVRIDAVEVAGYPMASGAAAGPASQYSFDSGDVRGMYIGKDLDSGQQLAVTVTNNTGGAVDVLGGAFLEC